MNFLFRRYFESKILLLRDSWIFLWRDFSKGENLFILSNFEYIYIYTKIFELHEFRIEDLFVSFLPSDFRIFFLDYHDKDISLWIFFSEDSSFSFYKQDVGTACISYYSFDSMHLESRTWIYIGNVSNTRVQLCSGKIWIFFFFFYSVTRVWYELLRNRGRQRERRVWFISASVGISTLMESDICIDVVFWNFAPLNFSLFDRVVKSIDSRVSRTFSPNTT